MTRNQKIGLIILGGAVYVAYSSGLLQSGIESVQAGLMGWQTVNEGPVWIPVINESENAYGIPTNLLARQAFQESHFRSSIINGTQASPAGALGILQLEPQYFSTVKVPIPFTESDVVNQITQAAQEMQRLYGVYGDWGLALAAYNDGEGNVNSYLNGSRQLPQETIDYVTGILADVPLPSNFATQLA